VISANRENAECDPHSNNTSVQQASKQQQQQQQQQQLLHQYRLDRTFNRHLQLHELQHSTAHFVTSAAATVTSKRCSHSRCRIFLSPAASRSIMVAG